jgi:alkylhydroperoxidase family enzyme
LIDTIREDRDPTALSPDEREIMTYVRDLLRTKRIPAPVFQALERKYSSQWLVELTGIVNFFAFVSGIRNAFEVPPPAGGDSLPRQSTNDVPD